MVVPVFVDRPAQLQRLFFRFVALICQYTDAALELLACEVGTPGFRVNKHDCTVRCFVQPVQLEL